MSPNRQAHRDEQSSVGSALDEWFWTPGVRPPVSDAAGEPAAPEILTPGQLLSGAPAAPLPDPLPGESESDGSETEPGLLPAFEPAPIGAAILRSCVAALRRTAGTGARLALVGFLAYALLFNLSVVRGNSMAPGIHDGDRILVNHLSLLFTEVERGDIVVLRYPLDPSVDYIKRVIGLPGDHIVLQDGYVWVNGGALEEPYIGSADPYSRQEVRVLKDHYFVLGDNRLHSSDSREFGQVPSAFLRGKVDLRVWPLNRLGTVD